MIQTLFLTSASASAQQIARLGRRRAPCSFVLEQLPRAARCASMPGFGGLVGREERSRQVVAQMPERAPDQLARIFRLLVQGQAHAQAELGVVLEERVGPGRAAAVVVDRPGRGRQVAAVDRRAAGGVGDDGAVAEELADSLRYGVSPQPAQAPENSNSGWRSWTSLTWLSVERVPIHLGQVAGRTPSSPPPARGAAAAAPC